MNFNYKAVTPEGESIEGLIDAPSETAALQRLGAQGLIPIRVDAAGGAASGTVSPFKLARPRLAWPWGKGLSQGDRLVFTQQMHSLLSAGIVLDRALALCAQGEPESKMGRLAARLRDEVVAGRSLSEAMRAQSGDFDRLYCALVQTGEGSGDLATSFAKLEEHLLAQQEIRATVVSALVYPIFLTVVSLASVLVLMIYVVPRFTKVLTDTGRELPLMTKIVLDSTGFLTHWGWLAALIVAFAVAGTLNYLRQPGPRLAWDGWKLRWPLIGELIRRVEVTRFARTLSTLLRAGVPMLPALKMVREVLINTAMAQTVDATAESLKEGQGVAGPLGKDGRFPRLSLQMMAIGEETGQLEVMLEKIAETFQRETQRTVRRLVSLMEPAVILVMGLIIGFIVIAILWGIVSVNDIPLE